MQTITNLNADAIASPITKRIAPVLQSDRDPPNGLSLNALNATSHGLYADSHFHLRIPISTTIKTTL